MPAGFDNPAFPLLSQVTDFWQLLWMFVSFLVLWIGVFTALKQNEITGQFSEGIKSMGEAAGKFAVSAPLAIPWIPAPGGGPNISPLQAWSAVNPQSNLSNLRAYGDLHKTFSAAKDRMHGTAAPRAEIDKVTHAYKTDTTVRSTIDGKITILMDPASNDAAKSAALDAIIGKINTNEMRAKNDGRNISDAGIRDGLAEVLDVNKSRAFREALEDRARRAANPTPPPPTPPPPP